jgi:uncharacterized membrane protein YidH (DUF202 family)
MKMKEFNLFLAQKRGMAHTGNTVNYIVGALIAVILVATLAGTIFSYLGTSGTAALGNTSANPSVPTWLPGILIVGVAVGMLFLVFRALGLTK